MRGVLEREMDETPAVPPALMGNQQAIIAGNLALDDRDQLPKLRRELLLQDGDRRGILRILSENRTVDVIRESRSHQAGEPVRDGPNVRNLRRFGEPEMSLVVRKRGSGAQNRN